MNYNEALLKAKEIVKAAADDFSKMYGVSDAWLGHVQVVEKYAVEFAKMRGADAEVVDLAAVLHDYGRYYDGAKYRKVHAEKGAELAREFLKDVDIPLDKKENIYNSILNHDKENAGIVNTPEGICLADADGFSHIVNCFEIYSFWLTTKKLGTKETLKLVYEKVQKCHMKMSDWAKEHTFETYSMISNYLLNALDNYEK